MATFGSARGAPGANDNLLGKFTDIGFYIPEASSPENPATRIELDMVQSFNVGPPEIDFSSKVFQFGGGNKYYNQQIGRTWPFTITFLQGAAFVEVAKILGVTHSIASDAIIPMTKQNDYPNLILEAACRDQDNSTHAGSVIMPDVILDDIPFDQVLDDSPFTLTGSFKVAPALLCDGASLAYEQFDGDGSTTDFICDSTPLNLTTAANWDHLYYDDFFYIKLKLTGESTGTISTSGYSLSTATITATTAPAASSVLQVLYAIETP